MAILGSFLSVAALAGNLPPVQTVFVILMENYDWSSIKGSTNAPYINNTLLPMAARCEQYYNPPGVHPSEPNYLWLEAGTDFGIADDRDPDINHQNTTLHLVTLLRAAGVSWKTYQEDISGATVPLTEIGGYVPKHNQFVFFDDVTGTNNLYWPYALVHIRPYTELTIDLANNNVARYNFITPNLCDDMHDPCDPTGDPIRQGDDWLAAQVPKILNSAAYRNGGALFITWDEGESDDDGPIGMILLSPLGRGGGYFNNIHYTHSSTLRTLQEIFGVTPLLGDAAKATDLSDLFCRFEITKIAKVAGGALQLTAAGVIPGRTNLVQATEDMSHWRNLSTNVVSTNRFTVTDQTATNLNVRYYRLRELP